MSIIVKTRRQGNSTTITVPKELDIPVGTKMKAIKTTKGIMYEFVEEEEEIDFSNDILKEILSEGVARQDIVDEFEKRKRILTDNMNRVVEKTLEEEAPMTREELMKEIGL